MTEFVGRAGALRVYSYPETPRRVNPLTAFARNFATGPKNETTIADVEVRIPWNAIDALATSSSFTVAAGGVTVSIVGDATGLFTNGNKLIVTPTTPVAGSPVNTLTVASVPVFAAGVTTFDLSAPIDGTTTGGTIDDQTNVPITPRSTGVVLVSGVVAVANTSGALCAVLVTVNLDGTPISPPGSMSPTVADSGVVLVPFLVEVSIPIGETHYISVSTEGEAATNVVLVGEGSSISIQEVSVATG